MNAKLIVLIGKMIVLGEFNFSQSLTDGCDAYFDAAAVKQSMCTSFQR